MKLHWQNAAAKDLVLTELGVALARYDAGGEE